PTDHLVYGSAASFFPRLSQSIAHAGDVIASHEPRDFVRPNHDLPLRHRHRLLSCSFNFSILSCRHAVNRGMNILHFVRWVFGYYANAGVSCVLVTPPILDRRRRFSRRRQRKSPQPETCLATGFSCFFGGAGDRTRTDDLLITSEASDPLAKGFLAALVSCVYLAPHDSRCFPQPCATPPG